MPCYLIFFKSNSLLLRVPTGLARNSASVNWGPVPTQHHGKAHRSYKKGGPYGCLSLSIHSHPKPTWFHRSEILLPPCHSGICQSLLRLGAARSGDERESILSKKVTHQTFILSHISPTLPRKTAPLPPPDHPSSRSFPRVIPMLTETFVFYARMSLQCPSQSLTDNLVLLLPLPLPRPFVPSLMPLEYPAPSPQ